MNTQIINQLATLLENDSHVIDSSNGRHRQSGAITASNASGITLKDGESRPKAVRDAFSRRNAATLILASLTPDVAEAVNVQRAVLRQEVADARKAPKADKVMEIAKATVKA